MAAPALRRIENHIAGRAVAATGEAAREIVSPVTGEAIGVAPEASAGDVARAVEAARAAQPGWEALSAWDRARLCVAIADAIDRRREELARLTTLEQGKPYHAEALADVEESADLFRMHAEDVKRMETAVIPVADVRKRVFTVRRANGVYGLITPWNFPLLIPAELIAPAIVTGNTVVIKPSEWTPLVVAAFMEAIADADLPPGVINAVYGGGEVGAALVRAPVDAIGFVGSHATAERIVRAAGLKRTMIEASGNGPVVVLDDADVAAAARGAVYGGFFCSGQVCCATERVIVDRRVHDELVEAVLREAEAWPLGDPFEAATLVGPLNNEPTAAKMDRHVRDAVEKGAVVLRGGQREVDRPTRLYYEPTVIDGVAADTLINREETFGPIVPIITAASTEAALSLANETELGLQVAVYTRSLERALRFGDELRAGQVIVNDSTDWWEIHTPFGGAGGTRTGWGRVGGRHALESMTDLRTIVMDAGGPDRPRGS